MYVNRVGDVYRSGVGDKGSSSFFCLPFVAALKFGVVLGGLGDVFEKESSRVLVVLPCREVAESLSDRREGRVKASSD